MNVVSITDGRRVELIEILHGLIAKAEEEGPFDIALCLTDAQGHDFLVLTGRYRRDPATLAQAAFQMQYRAMATNDPHM